MSGQDADAQILKWRDEDVAEADDLAPCEQQNGAGAQQTNIFVLDVLEQLEFAVGAFTQHRSAEWLHDLLDRD